MDIPHRQKEKHPCNKNNGSLQSIIMNASRSLGPQEILIKKDSPDPANISPITDRRTLENSFVSNSSQLN